MFVEARLLQAPKVKWRSRRSPFPNPSITGGALSEYRRTPDMTGKAAEIDDPQVLYARIGYRTFLKYRDGKRAPADLYDGHCEAELRRLLALNPKSSS